MEPTSVRSRDGAILSRGIETGSRSRSAPRSPGPSRNGRDEPGFTERAVRFGQGSRLVGIVTEPRGVAVRRTGMILVNAGILHRVGPSRMNVRMARAFARSGFPSLRFDLSGIGDSDPCPDALTFEESSVRDVGEAMDQLASHCELDDFTLVGLCSGADLAYRAALAHPRIRAIAPIDGHSYHTWRYQLHRFGPRLLRLESWKNLLTGRTYVVPWLKDVFSASDGPEEVAPGGIFQRPLPPKEKLEQDLQELLDRGVRVLVVFSGGMKGRYNYGSQFRDAFRKVDFHGLLDEVYLPDADHTFTDPAKRDALVDTVARWAVGNDGA